MALDAISAETFAESGERILGSESGTAKGFDERTTKRLELLEVFLAGEKAGVCECHRQGANYTN